MILRFIQTESKAVRFFIAVVLAVVALVASGLAWLQLPLKLEATLVDVHINAGSSARDVAHQVAEAGVDVSEDLLYAWFRLSGKSRQIRAGSYELNAGITPRGLLDKFVRGDQALRSIAIIEGWTFRQARQALSKADALKQDSFGLTDEAIMATLGRAGQHPEGRFFPDTYTYTKGSSDLEILGRALKAMDGQLEAAWSMRRTNQHLQTPEQALILASIIEKETGRTADQSLISSVFHNRMAIGMRLQTDPTVIYGLGEGFNGNLRRSDLLADTPYNTYTRGGLPPTPISLPGKSALIAAIQPVDSKALYFVARGNGSSYFSETLNEHNRAVDKYQRGR